MDATARRYQSQQLKLKDSCDPCSAAKVRCTKEKPSCARCDKFGHRCYYSPARRIGPPHRSNSREHSSNSLSSSSNGPASATASTPSSLKPPGLNYSASISCGASQRTETAGQKPCLLLENPPSPDSTPTPSSSSTPGAASNSPGSSNHSSNSNTPSSNNCYGLLLGIIDSSADVADAGSFLSSSAVILSRVLICPCSQNLDVALLVAAGCNVVLDAVDAMVATNTTTEPPSSPASMDCNTMYSNPAARAGLLSELGRVANLVVQFTGRYEGIVDDAELRETLLGLAGEIRGRLQAAVEKATSEGHHHGSVGGYLQV
ncbi:hypothetical protein N656DRAFT_780786 [Canariomyces notabilis]|uniref:Zn(2)-C6 fungal-type domain-containing protein n=1 Tax=Canariomyces notabilis TaxID=2074819 RepID=A0AAN6YRR7_9PEZI|nr:hypothetical protein N656DRAFT_780786 [Canariomyces arenarius]